MLPAIRRIRSTRHSALCALLVACVSIPAARALQASGDTATKKPAGAKTSTAKTSTSPQSAGAKSTGTTTASGVHHSARRKKVARVRGQKKIDPERARTIQEALIREHYLGGEPTGTWNQASEDAMRRYQGDHGWQTKEVPDSRALIALGLGPSKDRLLNPESAMTTGPQRPAAGTPPNPPAPATPASAPIPSDSPSPQ